MNPPPALQRITVRALLSLVILVLPPPSALAQISRNLTLLSNMNLYPPPPGGYYRACWPYIHSDGREYVVLPTVQGVSIVRLTDPAHPVEVGFFGTEAPWAEARQYRHYIYMVTNENDEFTVLPNNTGLAIIDMRNPDHPQMVANLHSPIVNAHALEIDKDRGLLYLCGETVCTDETLTNCQESMKIFSLANPEQPTLLATYPTYVHHIHLKGTLGYASLLFEGGNDATDGFLAVLDLSDPSHPTEITRIVTPRRDQHSSWTSEDGRYLYADNEVARDGLTVWDVSTPSSPRLVFTFEDLPRHMFHKSRVLGTRLFLAYYTAGVRVMDIRNPAWPVEFAYYDTDPRVHDEGIFFGAFDVAPFYPSGIVTVSDSYTGLYVFRVDPVNYGIIRGTVREAPNGPTIAGATVTVQPAGMTVRSGRDGRYAFAVPAGGAATVTVSTFTFKTTSKSVAVALNSDQTVNFPIKRLPAGVLSGTVRAASGGSVLAGAEVEILGTPLRATANAQGMYTFPSVPVGAYDVRAARPGNAAKMDGLDVPKGRRTTQNFSLGSVLFFDDAETDLGWSLSDPANFAVGGFWERAVPAGKILCDDGSQIEPAQDHSPGPGTMCFTTSTFIVPCFPSAGAVAGTVTLTSPILHLGGIPDPRIGYWRWFQTILPGVNTLAPLTVQLSNDAGAHWVTVENYLTAKSAWEFAEIRVRDFLPNPGDVLLRFIVDNSAFEFHRPEVAIDDIACYAGAGSGDQMLSAGLPKTVPVFAMGAPRPTPTRGSVEVELTLGHPVRVRADVFDLHGRFVQTAMDGEMPAGHSVVRWNGRTAGGYPAASGVYWMAVRAGQEERKLKVVIVR